MQKKKTNAQKSSSKGSDVESSGDHFFYKNT